MNFYDILLARCLCCKAGSEAEPLNVTENGVYTADEGKAFNPVTVSVPLPSGTLPITENGIYDVYSYASVDVDVAGVGGITADDIAMRTISGAISGSASQINRWAFAECKSLTKIDFPNCENVGASAFQNCYSLTEISFPVCTDIGGSAFYSCHSLAKASFPVCTSIWNGAFRNCSSLAEISFPACMNIMSDAFINCSSLSEVSFPACVSIGSTAFRSCYNLLSFNLVGVSSVPVLSGTSVFYSTPIGGYTASTGGVYGSVYVPSSLLTAFQTAPNWSLIASERFVGV